MGANGSKTFQQVGAVTAGLTSWVSRSRKRRAPDGTEYDALGHCENGSPVKLAKKDGGDHDDKLEDASASSHEVDEGVGLSDSDEENSQESSTLNPDSMKQDDKIAQTEEGEDPQEEAEKQPLMSSPKRRSSRLKKVQLKRKTESPKTSIPEATKVKSPSKRRSLRIKNTEEKIADKSNDVKLDTITTTGKEPLMAANELERKTESSVTENGIGTNGTKMIADDTNPYTVMIAEKEPLMADNEPETVTEDKFSAAENDLNETASITPNGKILLTDNKPETVPEELVKWNENETAEKPCTAKETAETSEQPLTTDNGNERGIGEHEMDVNSPTKAEIELVADNETQEKVTEET